MNQNVVQDRILMRKGGHLNITDEKWRVVYLVMVPKVFRQDIMGLARDTPLAVNSCINKTCLEI